MGVYCVMPALKSIFELNEMSRRKRLFGRLFIKWLVDSVTYYIMTTGEMFPIERSNLYLVWIEEQEHIAKNRWYLSEKAGFDVGVFAAKHDWHMRHRPKWIASLRASGRYPS